VFERVNGVDVDAGANARCVALRTQVRFRFPQEFLFGHAGSRAGDDQT
jgi:hypothetical protein